MMHKRYTKEQCTAAEAQRLAQEIAFGPVVFQVSRLMLKFGIFQLLSGKPGRIYAARNQRADRTDTLCGTSITGSIADHRNHPVGRRPLCTGQGRLVSAER